MAEAHRQFTEKYGKLPQNCTCAGGQVSRHGNAHSRNRPAVRHTEAIFLHCACVDWNKHEPPRTAPRTSEDTDKLNCGGKQTGMTVWKVRSGYIRTTICDRIRVSGKEEDDPESGPLWKAPDLQMTQCFWKYVAFPTVYFIVHWLRAVHCL